MRFKIILIKVNSNNSYIFLQLNTRIFMKKSIVTGLLASAISASSVMASGAVMAKDGLGDFLISPMYMAKGNVCTELKVFNTNETNSVLAKVTFREQISSEEVDLPIFLSPGDVWYGEVCNENGKIILTSDDDSNHPKIAADLKSGRDLTAISHAAGHTNVDFSLGYAEIYPIAQFNEKSNEKVEKSVLVDRWDALASGDKSNSKLRIEGVDGYSLSGLTTYKNYKLTDILGIETAKLPMVAFKGTHSKQVTGSAIAYSMDTSPELLLGSSSKKEILKLLQNEKTSFTYSNGGKNQYISLTFPFSYSTAQRRSFEITVRDNEENKDIQTVIFSPKPKDKYIENEVELISVEEIIASTQNPSMFKSGMIQIKGITNIDNVQLGQGTSSYIPTSFSFVKTNPNKCNNETNMVLNPTYVPSK